MGVLLLLTNKEVGADHIVCSYSGTMTLRSNHCHLHDGGKVFLQELLEVNKFPTINAAKDHKRARFSMVNQSRTGLNQYQQLPTRWATLFKMLLPEKDVYSNTASAGVTSDISSRIATKAKANFGEEVVLRMVTDCIQALSDAAITEFQRKVYGGEWKSLRGKIKVMISFPLCFKNLGTRAAYIKLESAAQGVKWKHGATFELVTDHKAALCGALYAERNQAWLSSAVSSSLPSFCSMASFEPAECLHAGFLRTKTRKCSCISSWPLAEADKVRLASGYCSIERRARRSLIGGLSTPARQLDVVVRPAEGFHGNNSSFKHTGSVAVPD
jgi:hypothetical protein